MSNPNCKHSCIGCERTEPELPHQKMIQGIPHISVRPACHHAVDEHPYVRGGVTPKQQSQMEQQTNSVHQPGAEVW